MPEQLSAEQVFAIGILATVVAQVVKMVLARKGTVVHRKVITVALYVISIVLGYLWARPALPLFPAFPVAGEDPAAFAALVIGFIGAVIVWAGQLIAVASAIVGFATLIYNLLLAKVFSLLGWETVPAPPAEAPVELA